MSINYTEKGIGLHDAIKAAGHFLRQENGAWLSSNDTAVQAIMDAYLLADVQADIGAQIDAAAKLIRERFLRAVSPMEMSAWATKYQEAVKFQASGLPADAPNLQAEATFRSVTLTNLANKVVNNFNAIANREAKISGIAGKHKDAVKALATFAAVLAYDWQTPMAGA